jgi:thioesterase domain-containing protein
MPGISDGYAQLAQHIPDSGAVHGLQMKGFMGDEEPLTSIEEMAAHNVALIQSMDNAKKISLYAHSYGGTVVYEMLRQLKQTDIEVIDIVLIDSYPFRHIAEGGKESLSSFIKSFLLNAEEYEVEMEKRIGQDALNHLQKLMEQSLSVNYERKEQLDYNIHLVIAEQGLEDHDLQQRREWKHYFQHVTIIKAAGDHFSVVKEPYCSKWLSEVSNKTKELHQYSETDY